MHGASGGVGVAAVQMAAERGCTVVGTAGTDDGAKLVLTNGATDVFNHRTAGYLEEMKKKYPEGEWLHCMISVVLLDYFGICSLNYSGNIFENTYGL